MRPTVIVVDRGNVAEEDYAGCIENKDDACVRAHRDEVDHTDVLWQELRLIFELAGHSIDAQDD